MINKNQGPKTKQKEMEVFVAANRDFLYMLL